MADAPVLPSLVVKSTTLVLVVIDPKTGAQVSLTAVQRGV